MQRRSGTQQQRGSGGLRVFRVVAALSALTLVLLALPAGATFSSTNYYTANVTPHSVAVGSTTAFTATLVNQSSSKKIGSADITAPPGFVVTGVSTGTFTSSVVSLRGLAVPKSGGSTSVTITAIAPCTAGSSPWSVKAKSSPYFSGSEDFTLKVPGSDLSNSRFGTCHLNFATQPADAAKTAVITSTPFNSPLGSAVQVEVLDGANARITSPATALSTATIAVALDPSSPNPAPGAVLSGTLSTNAVAGVASFANLSINLHGDYRLQATSTGLESAISDSGPLHLPPNAFTIWDNIATCPVGQGCATTVTQNNFSASFSGTSTTNGFLLLSVGQDAPSTLDCGDPFFHAPVVTSGSMYQFASTKPKTMTGTIDRSLVQGTLASLPWLYRVCFESDKPFIGRDGNLVQPGTPALLPDCKPWPWTKTPPCVESITWNWHFDIVIKILLPPDDPQRWR